MAKNSVRLISTTLMPWINYMDDLSRQPSARTKASLDAVLQEAYMESQANVHVISGRLRTSGRVQSDTRKTPRTGRYTGEIGYGQGIDYAEYELGGYNTQHHGPRTTWPTHPDHDPLSGMEHYYAQIDTILGMIGE